MQISVVEWLTRTAECFPDKDALYDEEEFLTYKQYHDKSIGIASEIVKTEIGIKKPVIIYLAKSIKVPVSFMGVAYSGNFYCPIDVNMPAKRVEKIIEILKPELAITTQKLKLVFEEFNYDGNYIIYEDVEEKEEDFRVNQVISTVTNSDLLYVLFTSGSTGTPKGVCITHQGVIDYIDCVTDIFSVSSNDRFGNQAPFYFDNSILDIYATLKTGATLYIIPQNLFMQPVRLLEYLKNYFINTIFWVPSALIVVSKLKAFREVDLTNTLKRVLFCGEVMPNKQLNIWREYLPNVLYANLYGPTEITDACTYYIVDREFSDDESLPIGIPMKNTSVLILDEQDHLVREPNVVGELCVRGIGVSAGYYNDWEKTDKVFVQNPLNSVYREIIYRTGDLVQYNDKRELLFLCRKDSQIKHLGHRIELGEIETVVSSLKNVTQCCCLYDEKKERIVLFIDQEMTKRQINTILEKLLPKYMLPGKVVYLSNFPLNANGKIDRVKLREGWI